MRAKSHRMSATAAPTQEMLNARRPVVPSAVLGTLILVVAETMFFVGMISAFTITKAGTQLGNWPPPGQPTLPASSTAWNTAALIVSGLLLLAAQFRFSRGQQAKWLVAASWVLGALFVGLQGAEWVSLLSQGLTLTSSRMGAFFYLIVGTHAAHAVGALLCLGWVTVQFMRGSPNKHLFFGAQTFWYFVVLLWPIIYVRVYF